MKTLFDISAVNPADQTALFGALSRVGFFASGIARIPVADQTIPTNKFLFYSERHYRIMRALEDCCCTTNEIFLSCGAFSDFWLDIGRVFRSEAEDHSPANEAFIDFLGFANKALRIVHIHFNINHSGNAVRSIELGGLRDIVYEKRDLGISPNTQWFDFQSNDLNPVIDVILRTMQSE